MPRYSYTHFRGRERLQTVERHFPLGKAPKRIHIEDIIFEKDAVADALTQGVATDWPEPMLSHGAGFGRKQRLAALRAAERDRVPLELDGRGRAVFRNDAQRRKVLKWRGLHPNDCYNF